jgi:hypothetical protein
MALRILDGNQSATTLSTILSSGEHITAHTVVSLGTQAITDMRSAVSGSVVSISNLPSTQTIAGTVTANLGLNELPYIKANINITETGLGTLVTNVFMRRIGQYKYQSISGWAGGEDEAYVEIELKQFENDQFFWKASSFGGASDINSGEFAFALPQNAGGDNGNPFPPTTFSPLAGFTGTMTVSYEQPSTQPISGTVTIGNLGDQINTFWADNAVNDIGNAVFAGIGNYINANDSLLISGVVTANPTGTQTIAGTVTIGAGTAQIGSVTASISNSVTIASFATSVTARLINPAGTAVTYAEVGTAGSPSIDVLSIQGVTSGTPINVYPQQGTTVSNTNFTSTNASTTLVSAVALRESLTVFSEGPGNLFISPGATATTISYQVRLSPGDYWECPAGQLSLAHTAVFATAGTARVTEVS